MAVSLKYFPFSLKENNTKQKMWQHHHLWFKLASPYYIFINDRHFDAYEMPRNMKIVKLILSKHCRNLLGLKYYNTARYWTFIAFSFSRRKNQITQIWSLFMQYIISNRWGQFSGLKVMSLVVVYFFFPPKMQTLSSSVCCFLFLNWLFLNFKNYDMIVHRMMGVLKHVILN